MLRDQTHQSPQYSAKRPKEGLRIMFRLHRIELYPPRHAQKTSTPNNGSVHSGPNTVPDIVPTLNSDELKAKVKQAHKDKRARRAETHKQERKKIAEEKAKKNPKKKRGKRPKKIRKSRGNQKKRVHRLLLRHGRARACLMMLLRASNIRVAFMQAVDLEVALTETTIMRPLSQEATSM